jgi:hypothetical protein
MHRFNTINNLLGWTVFLISAIIYILTLEPTASWWDTSEFIVSAWKLEVGHPPGAPFHIILGRFFTLFAPDSSQAAFMVNLLSGLASAGTVMLLYWSIVHLARKLFPERELTPAEQIAVWGSGIVGSLAFAFTDSFWFSAVEGEVYALSSFFTAAVFWAILKWENEAERKYANRWLILIAYLLGLSTGVHLLNLLAIPAIGLVYYFRMYRFSWKGFMIAFLVSMAILAGIQWVIIPGVPLVAFWSDLFFVNVIGLPFNTGMLFFIVLLVAVLVWAIRYTHKNRMVVLNTIVLSITVILIGYSSVTLILIRAAANPPMNQNHPDNAFALLRYLNRDQYGSVPLLYGPYYNSPALANKGEKKYYNQVDGKYVVTGTSASGTIYHPATQTIFPRMHSSDPSHAEVYRQWGNVKGKQVRVEVDGEEEVIIKPTFAENLSFFFTYQMGHMYFRYFMWNFAGRQNDTPGYGNFMHGNWISGIKFLDEQRLGPTDNMPEFMKNDPSRNAYYFLPLLFGLIGLFYQYNHSSKGRQGFAVVLALFFFTGIAIIIYLNQTPMQPRERDYAYVGSFYAFSIWIGLAVIALYHALVKVKSGTPAAVTAGVVSLVLVPGLLLSENYHDHNRLGRYMTRDYAINYLESCAPNAILLTYGDNDTFPLWYVQEVEGIRTDVKVVNISYLGMDWYITQQRMATYEAPPVPFSFDEDKYYMGRRDAVLILNRIEGAIDLRDAMMFMGSDDERSKVETVGGQKLDYLPAESFYIPVDRQKVLQTGTVQPEDAELIADTVVFDINKNYITKSEWALLNMVAANDWERPIYIDHSLLYTGLVFFTEWLQMEGLAYRLVPIRTDSGASFAGHINTGILYENVMKKFVWGNVNDPDIYLDDYNKRAIRIIQARYMFSRLAEALVNEDQNQKAVEVVDRMFELFPDEKMPLGYDSFPAAEQYFRAGATSKGVDKVRVMAENSLDMLRYYITLPDYFAQFVEGEQEREINLIQNLMVLARRYNQTDLTNELDSRLQSLIQSLSDEMN